MDASIKDLLEGIHNDFHEFKKVNDKRLDEIDKRGDALGLTKEHTTKLNDAISEQEALVKKQQDEEKERKALEAKLEELTAKVSRPAAGSTTPEDEKKALHQKAWNFYVKTGTVPSELKANEFIEGTDEQGGFLVPQVLSDAIVEKIAMFSPIRQLASVITMSGPGSALEMPQENVSQACAWAAETGGRAQSVAPTFTKLTIPLHEMFCFPYVSQPMIDDSAFSIDSYITKKAGEQMGVLEGVGFVTGDASAPPVLGIIGAVYTTVDTSADGSGVAVTADGLFEVYYGLNAPYRGSATWLMNVTTIKAIRLLKNTTTTEYLWTPGFAQTPPTILGQPVVEAKDFQDPGTDANVVMGFGDWKSAYTIVDKGGVTVLRDPYSVKPYVGFYIVRRVGGAPSLAEAAVIGSVADTS